MRLPVFKALYKQPSGIFDELGSDSEALSAVLNIDSGDNLEGESAERYFADCVRILKRKELNQRLAEAKERSARTETTQELLKITKEINEIAKELKKL